MTDSSPDEHREAAANVAYLAERFAAAYYGNDPEWPQWLADLRVALAEMEAPDA